MEIEKVENKNSAKRVKALIIAVAAVLIVGGAIAAIFLFTGGKPLSEAIVGKWEYSAEDMSLLTSSVESLIGEGGAEEFEKIAKDKVSYKEFFNFGEGGIFSITVDKNLFVTAQNNLVDALIEYYENNTDAFYEKAGFSKEEFERIGVNESNFKEFLNSLFSDARQSIASKASEFECDEDGDILLFLGGYTVEDDRVSIVSSEGKEYEFTMKATSTELEIKTSNFDVIEGLEGKVFTKVNPGK